MAGIVAPIRDILTQMSAIQAMNQTGVIVQLTARIWNDQLKKIAAGELEYVPFPAGFLEVMAPTEFLEIGQGIGAGDITFRVHLAHEFMDAQDGTFEQDLIIFELRDQIIANLSHFKPTGCGLMSRTSETQDFEHTNIYHYIVEFVCHFIDDRGSNDITQGLLYKAPPTDVDLEISVQKTPIVLSQQTFNI